MSLRTTRLACARALAWGCLAAAAQIVQAGVDQWTSNGPYGGQVSVLAADPKNPSVLYAAGFSGVFKTTDGALTWSRASDGITDPTIAAIAIDPVTTSTVYAGSIQGGHTIKSTDGGATWNALATGPTLVIAIAIPAQSPSTIYVARQQAGLMKSADGGATWANIGVATLPSFPTFKSIVVDPTNPNTLYAGEASKGVYKSVDGGATWAASSTGFTTGSVIQVLSLAIDRSNPATLYAAANTSTSAGLYKSTNAGATWTQVFTDASSVIGVQAVAVDPSNSAIVYMGTFGQGLRKSINGGTTFTAANTGLPKVGVNVVAINPASAASVFVGTENGVFASTNSGAGWTAASNGLALVTVNAIAVDPQVPTTVYAATKQSGLWKSVDGGDSWQAINGGIGVTGNLACNMPNFSALAIDPTSPSTVYVGTQCTLDSQVYKTIDGGASWAVAATGLPGFSNVNSFAIDYVARKVYAAAGNAGLFVSGNGGANWAIKPELPAGSTITDVGIIFPPTAAVATRPPVLVLKETDQGGKYVPWMDEGDGKFAPVPGNFEGCIAAQMTALYFGGVGEDDFDVVAILVACISGAKRVGNDLIEVNGFTYRVDTHLDARGEVVAKATTVSSSFAWGPPDGKQEAVNLCAPANVVVANPSKANGASMYVGASCGVLRGTANGAQLFTMSNGLPAGVSIISLAPTPSGADIYAGARTGGVWKYTPSGAPASATPVVEYYNATLDHYFITWVAAEQANLDAGNTPTKWTRTGESFKTYTAAQAGTSPVCRYYIPPNLGDSHFFGRGTAECVATGQKNPSFVQESADFMQMFLPTAGVCPANTTNIYRVFSNRPDANHRYMTSKTIRDQMAAKGWLVEGDGPDAVVMCAPM